MFVEKASVEQEVVWANLGIPGLHKLTIFDKTDVFVGTDDDKSKIRVHPVDDRTSADLWNISFVKRSFVSPNFGSNAYVPAIRTSTFLWLRGLLGFRGFGFDGFLGFLLSNDFLRRFLALSSLFDACASGQYQTEHNEND